MCPRHDEDLREPLVRRQGSQVSMRVARGSSQRAVGAEEKEGARAKDGPGQVHRPKEGVGFKPDLGG